MNCLVVLISSSFQGQLKLILLILPFFEMIDIYWRSQSKQIVILASKMICSFSALGEQTIANGISLYNIMKEQNQSPEARFTIEKFSAKGPFYLQPQQKVAHLQNKVTFYEGQIDPLYSENTQVKQNHMNLSRIVSISTEILRNLLPIGNSPAKKLKLEMATIDEIAKMIETDWRDMEQLIASLQSDKTRMGEEIQDWKERLKNESQRRVREVNQLQSSMQKLRCQYDAQVENLQQKIRRLYDEMEKQREKAFNQQALRDKLLESVSRELELFKHESKCKQNDYERCIARLKGQMDVYLAEFQEGKKMVKQICQKLMNDKLAEQAEAYEMMLRSKEQEKFSLQLSMSEMTEEHAKKLKEKDDEIQMLTNKNQAKKIQIKRLEDELYNKKQELMQEIKDNKELQTQLLRANQKIQAFLDRIHKQEATICQQAEKIKITIEQYEQSLKALKDSGAQTVSQMLQEKKKLLAQAQEKEKYIDAMRDSLGYMETVWKEKLQMATKKWLEKQSEYTAQIIKANKRIQEQKERTKRMKQDRERQVANLGKQHEQLLRRLQRQFKQSKEAYVRDYTAKMRQLMDENEQEVKKVRQKLKKQFQGEMYKREEQMKRKVVEFQLMIKESEKKWQSERRRYQQQIKTIKVQEKLLYEQLAKSKQDTLDRENEMQKLKIEQLKAIKKLQLQNELNNKKLQEMMEQQMQLFLKELQEKDEKISTLREQNQQDRQTFQRQLHRKEAELVSMKEHMQKEINALKDTSAVGEMQKMYKSELAALESSLKAKLFETQQNYQRQIDSINERNQRLMKQLIQDYDRQLANTNNSFQKALGGLALQFKKRSTFFNDRYLSEEMEVNPQKLSQEEKISFIRLRMEEAVKLLLDRDNQIADLNKKIQRFEIKFQEEMAIRRKELQIEKSILINDCNNKIQKQEELCRLRVAAAEKERRQFSDEMFKQFETMRESYNRQFQSLERKYKQLQILFSERPSRAEDVSKIKELISIQTNLDQEIIIYHKKMETANEIVKYLNLQLENYKETYDIFRPHEHAYNKTISFTDDTHKMMEMYKQQEKAKGQRQVIHYDKRLSESPDIKQLRIFTEKEDQKSESLVIEPKEVMGRSRKYSFVPEKFPPTKERFKTEKIADREIELMGHAETFMKLIKKNTTEVSVIRELESNEDIKKKTYRRRKLKRLPTGVVQHYF